MLCPDKSCCVRIIRAVSGKLMLCHDMPRYVKVCDDMLTCLKMYHYMLCKNYSLKTLQRKRLYNEGVSRCVKLCQDVICMIEMCQVVPSLVNFCQVLLTYANLRQVLIILFLTTCQPLTTKRCSKN